LSNRRGAGCDESVSEVGEVAVVDGASGRSAACALILAAMLHVDDADGLGLLVDAVHPSRRTAASTRGSGV